MQSALDLDDAVVDDCPAADGPPTEGQRALLIDHHDGVAVGIVEFETAAARDVDAQPTAGCFDEDQTFVRDGALDIEGRP
jgi:hypothetical protein